PPPSRPPFPTRRSSDLVREEPCDRDDGEDRCHEDGGEGHGDLLQCPATSSSLRASDSAGALSPATRNGASRWISSSSLSFSTVRSEEHTSELQSPYDLV